MMEGYEQEPLAGKEDAVEPQAKAYPSDGYADYLRSRGLRPGATIHDSPVPLDAPEGYRAKFEPDVCEEEKSEPDFPPEAYDDDEPRQEVLAQPDDELYEIDLKAGDAMEKSPCSPLGQQGVQCYADALSLDNRQFPLAQKLYETSGLSQLPDAIASADGNALKEIGGHLLGGMLADSMLMTELARAAVVDGRNHDERMRRMSKLFEAQRNSTALFSAIKVLKGPASVKIAAKQVNVSSGPQQALNSPSKLGQGGQPEQADLF